MVRKRPVKYRKFSRIYQVIQSFFRRIEALIIPQTNNRAEGSTTLRRDADVSIKVKSSPATVAAGGQLKVGGIYLLWGRQMILVFFFFFPYIFLTPAVLPVSSEQWPRRRSRHSGTGEYLDI